MSPQTAGQLLSTLEPQLMEALDVGVEEEALVRRYYFPMFAAAISLGNWRRARSKPEAKDPASGYSRKQPA